MLIPLLHGVAILTASGHCKLALTMLLRFRYRQFDRRMGELMEACTAAVGAPASNATCSSSADGAAANGSTATGADAANGPIFVVCRRGNHSQLAVQRLRAAGYSEAIDLIGGMAAWGTSVDEAMPNLG